MCSSGCPTGDCPSYAACLRNKGAKITYSNSANNHDASNQKRWDRELGRYRDLVKSGVQPAGTTHRDMDKAERMAEVGKHEAPTGPPPKE